MRLAQMSCRSHLLLRRDVCTPRGHRQGCLGPIAALDIHFKAPRDRGWTWKMASGQRVRTARAGGASSPPSICVLRKSRSTCGGDNGAAIVIVLVHVAAAKYVLMCLIHGG